MIDWYIDITEWAPDSFRKDDFLKSIIDTADPYMTIFCERLSQISDWKLEDANSLFKEIAEEFPVMQPEIWNDEFRIRYNRWVYIKLTDTTKQIYRESKLKNILA